MKKSVKSWSELAPKLREIQVDDSNPFSSDEISGVSGNNYKSNSGFNNSEDDMVGV